MKHIYKFIAAAAAVCMLGACADRNESSSVTDSVETATDAEATEKNAAETSQPADQTPLPSSEPLEPSDMPVISIVTNDQSAGVLSFVTDPVSKHVAESIASWTPGYKMPPEPYYEDCAVTVTDMDGTVLIGGADAQVKVRGNWTTNYAKKPLRIKFAEKKSMIGLNGGNEYRNWVLLACYKDGSMMRDKAALAAARGILGADGLYASDAEFVEVEINGVYWGVYLLAEMQQINTGRVDITEAEKDYEGTDIGYFMEFDGYYVNEDPMQAFHVDYMDNAPLVPFDGNGGSGREMCCLSTGKRDWKEDIGITIKSDIYSQAQHDFIAGFVDGVYDIMYLAAYEDEAYKFNDDYTDIVPADGLTPQQAVENVVNVDSLADMYIISELTCDADIYWSSFFMDADFGEGGEKRLTFEAPWDFDSGLGNKDRCADGTGFYAANIVPDVNGGVDGGGAYDSINPWLAVLMYEDWFQDIIREKWTNAYDSGVFSCVTEMLESDAESHKKTFAKNYQRWNNLINNSEFAGELSYGAAKCKTHAEAAEYLESWFKARVDFMNDYWHE